MSKPNSRITDLWAGVCITDPKNHSGPQAGVIITGSSNHNIENLGVARTFDLVLSFCGHVGFVISGSPSAKCNSISKARVTDMVVGQIVGVIITGGGKSESE